jgi:calcineurin-like phosphoesterase family protein
MTVWFTADLHLGHGNIIEYSRRPFVDVESMNQALIQKWNSVVQPADTVWVLGDIALGRIDESLALVSELHGRKLLLAGNHDRCWSGHGQRAEGWTQRYLDAGFAEIHQGQRDILVDSQSVHACHFPYRGDSRDQDRYTEHRPADDGDWLLHGHVHERWRQRERMINVGVDAWNYRPVSESELTALIDLGPNDIEAPSSNGEER